MEHENETERAVMDAGQKSGFSSYTSDQLRELYCRDPDLFDELAALAISEACIGSTVAQTLRLRQLQWVIDAHLRKGKTPLQRMHIMENIFYDRIYGRGGLLADLISGWAELRGALIVRGHGVRKKSTLRLLKRAGSRLIGG